MQLCSAYRWDADTVWSSPKKEEKIFQSIEKVIYIDEDKTGSKTLPLVTQASMGRREGFIDSNVFTVNGGSQKKKIMPKFHWDWNTLLE